MHILPALRRPRALPRLLVLPAVFAAVLAFAAPPDSAPDYETLTTGLGMGILFEPVLGASLETQGNDRYVPAYGDAMEARGFTTVRVRIPMSQFTDNTTGTYPNLELTAAFFTDLQALVDDLLLRHNHTMYVVISPNGLETGTADDTTQMANYWGQIAEHFKDYTHRLIFNLMNEPFIRTGEFTSLAQVESLYQAVTDRVRVTNPSRYLVYLQMQNLTVLADATKREEIPFSFSGPGESDFNHMAIPASAGTNYIVDFHPLGTQDANGTAKRLAVLRQASEYRAVTGRMVWAGVWNWGSWDTSWNLGEVTTLANEMKRLGIPGTFMMFNSSLTSLFDGNGTDRDLDTVFNEWTKPEIADLVATRNPIFWQKNQIHPVTRYHADADAYVKGGTFVDEAISGELQELQVRNIRTSYLRFNVNRVPGGTITSAKLRLRTAATTDVGSVSVHLVNDNNWSERTISQSTAPTNGAVLNTQLISTPETYVEWDVTPAVIGAGTYSFVLKLTTSTTNPATPMRFYSRDSDKDPNWLNGPELIVTVEPSAAANTAPTFTANPITGAAGSTGAPYTGSLAAHVSNADGDPLRYGKTSGPAWLTVGQDGSLSGTPTATDLGLNTFALEVSDGRGGTATTQLNVNVTAGPGGPFPPAISVPPASQTVAVGADVILSVTATGTAPLSYQWFKGGEPIPDAKGEILSLTDVQLTHAGSYTVAVTNSLDTATSTAAVLTVNPAVTGIAAWRQSKFPTEDWENPARSGPQADPDNDGLTNLLEYALDLDPLLADGVARLGHLELSGNSVVFHYQFATGRADVSVVPEVSSSLASWTDAGLVTQYVSTENGMENWTATATYSGASVFLRLRVELR